MGRAFGAAATSGEAENEEDNEALTDVSQLANSYLHAPTHPERVVTPYRGWYRKEYCQTIVNEDGDVRVRVNPVVVAVVLRYFLAGKDLGLRTILGTVYVLVSVVVITTTKAKPRLATAVAEETCQNS